MATYQIPQIVSSPTLSPNEAFLIASGDLRLSANQKCWLAQQEMEQSLTAAVASHEFQLVRAHQFKGRDKHGFIASQKEGMANYFSLYTNTPSFPLAEERGQGVSRMFKKEYLALAITI